LSNPVSTCLLRYKPGTDKQMAETLENFISDINLWFDIFNSYCAKGKVPTKNAYGVSLENQEKHLDNMIQIISSIRAIGKNALQTFQKGMIISMKSLKSLFYDMKSKLDIKYICTHRLNQDSLENFFFQIRSRGGSDEHPSPLAAIYRIRMIMLGKNPGILGSKVNTESKTTDEYIVPQVLETAKIEPQCECLRSSVSRTSRWAKLVQFQCPLSSPCDSASKGLLISQFSVHNFI
jgi:predicted transcriptional regulator